MSEFNRRDLLKFFGIGATVVPVIGGAPQIEAPAKLIEIPKLEALPAPRLCRNPAALVTAGPGPVEIEVYVRTAEAQYRFSASSFLTRGGVSIADRTGNWHGFIPKSMTWELRGEVTGEPQMGLLPSGWQSARPPRP